MSEGIMASAYSYLRFSTPEQAKGDSSRRQLALARDYAQRNGLELDEKLTFHDLGVSAFRGRNSETGRLGEFLEAVKEGIVPSGSFLLVESLDRISRQAARKALRALENIVETGITVVTLSDGKAYTAETIDDDPMSLMLALMIFIRSNEESATKSRRLKASWENKRANAATKPLTARAPTWLELDTDRKWVVRQDRAAIVRRIYELAAQGTGEHLIAATLNRDGVPPFGNGSRRGLHWHRTSVIKLLESPSVGGTYVPYTYDYVGGKKHRVRQEPVEGYFPVIVDRELREIVWALRRDSSNPQRGRHAESEVRNILGGLARCPICTGTMTRVSKGSGDKAGPPFLVCQKAKVGAGCRYRAVRIEDVEHAIKTTARWLFRSVNWQPKSFGDPIQKLRAAIVEAESRRDNLVDAIASGSNSPALMFQLAHEERSIATFDGLLKDHLRRAEIEDSGLLTRRFEEAEALLGSFVLDRGRLNVVLRQILASVRVQYGTGLLEFEWKTGGKSVIKFAARDDWTKAKEEWREVARELTRDVPDRSIAMHEDAWTAVIINPASIERAAERSMGRTTSKIPIAES